MAPVACRELWLHRIVSALCGGIWIQSREEASYVQSLWEDFPASERHTVRLFPVGTSLLSRLDAAETPHLPCLDGRVLFPAVTHRATKRYQKVRMQSAQSLIRPKQTSMPIRHDPLVLRQEDGAVEFRILAPMFRSECTSSQHWSIRTWLNYLQRGRGPKKRFQYCVDPYSADTILYLRASDGHSGGKRINSTLQGNLLLPSEFAEHIYHVGSSHDMLSITKTSRKGDTRCTLRP